MLGDGTILSDREVRADSTRGVLKPLRGRPYTVVGRVMKDNRVYRCVWGSRAVVDRRHRHDRDGKE